MTSLQNVVITADMKCDLDLPYIGNHCTGCEFDAKKFHAAKFRLLVPRTTTLIFKNGKIVCLGAKSIEQALIAANKVKQAIRDVGFDTKMEDFKVRNMVGSATLGFEVLLPELHKALGYRSIYETVQFPGISYRLEEPKITVLIFHSGKMIFTGAKSESDIHRAYEKMYPIVSEFKRL
jgi:transcription initiation factor TFIID TATA-box-binding protein